MASRRVFPPPISFTALALLAACSKTNAPTATKTDASPMAGETSVATGATPKASEAGPCGAPEVSALLAEITREESAKSALDETAKHAPDRANFRKVYDAETAFVAATEDRTAKLAACGASAAILADVKARLEKSRANLTYLRESFPDFN